MLVGGVMDAPCDTENYMYTKTPSNSGSLFLNTNISGAIGGRLPLKDFTKHDGDKIRYDMFPDNVLQDVCRVLMFGAQKYEENNWKKCEDLTRYYNASRRHIEAWRTGEYRDKDSGLPHLAHALCNLMFIHYLEEEKINAKQKA